MQTVISQSGLQSGLSDVCYVTLANSLVKHVVSGYSQSPDPVRKQSGLSPERAKTIVFHMQTVISEGPVVTRIYSAHLHYNMNWNQHE